MGENRKVTQTRIVLPGDTNGHNTLFGGKLMSYIDDVSSIAALRYARRTVVTASTDSVDFLHPIGANHSVTVEAFVSGAGRKSMEVFVKVTGEDFRTGKTYLAATAFNTFVVVDGNKEPVPTFIPETPGEKLVNKDYQTRKEQRKIRRFHNQEFINRVAELD